MQVAKLDPGNTSMDRTVKRLTPIVAERREKLKDEMLGVQSSQQWLLASTPRAVQVK